MAGQESKILEEGSRNRFAGMLRSLSGVDERVIYGVILVLGLALPLAFLQQTYYLRIGTLVCMYFVLALGYNAVVTTAGLFDLGYTAYFAVGAYASALLMLHTNLSFWIIFPLSILATLVYVLIVSVPILRFKGDYLCIITLAFAEILRLVLNNWLEVTRGPLGLPGIRDPQIFSYTFNSLIPYYYLAFLVAIAALILVNRLTYSAVGLRWSGVRENPDAAESVGINTHRAKVHVYLVGAGLAGAVGAVFAPFQGIVDPSAAHLDNTVIILTMVILGGGSNYGLLASAAVLTVVPELLRGLTTYRLLALGLFFVFIMNLRPGGFRFSVLKHFVLPEWEKKPGEDKQVVAPAVTHEIVFGSAAAGKPDGGSADVPREVILRGENVTKRFGGLVAVDDVTFELCRGEILGVIGPNGAGKTTLFNMITGTYPPFAGDIFLRDRKITGWDPHKIARLRVARTFQIIKLLPNLTVLDNTMLACLQESAAWNGHSSAGEVTRRPDEEAIELARAAISYVGLAGQEDTIAKNLSFGNRRLLELARALATQPYLILMDEPASGMNPQEVRELIDLIRGINQQGLSILLIEHNMTVAMELSDRLIVLDHGEKIAEGTPDEVQQNKRVIDAYLGREQEVASG